MFGRSKLELLRDVSVTRIGDTLSCGFPQSEYAIESLKYSNYPEYRNSIFHLRPKNVSYNMKLSGNEGQSFLYEGHKSIARHMSLQCLSTLIQDTGQNKM